MRSRSTHVQEQGVFISTTNWTLLFIEEFVNANTDPLQHCFAVIFPNHQTQYTTEKEESRIPSLQSPQLPILIILQQKRNHFDKWCLFNVPLTVLPKCQIFPSPWNLFNKVIS